MELITPSFEIWAQDTSSPIEGMYAHIARCTRVCYQSEKKDDKETEEEFVKRVILRNLPFKCEANHLAMLEHGTVYLAIPFTDSETLSHYRGCAGKYNEIEFTKYSKVTMMRGTHNYVTTNLRVLVENDWLDDLKYVCPPTPYHALRITVSFTTNIGVTREFNRHRVDSIAEESTRYCNYNKRQDGEIKIGLPAWIKDENCPEEYIRDLNNMSIAEYCTDFVDNDTDVSDIWDEWCYYFFALKACEFAYNGLISKGWKPQQAREVLPLATKSQLIHTAFVDDWRHFFALRADGVSGPPHPNARLLAKPLYEEFKKRNLL